jgi:hypothetical protein
MRKQCLNYRTVHERIVRFQVVRFEVKFTYAPKIQRPKGDL